MAADDMPPMWAARLRAERERRSWNKHEMARRLQKATGRPYPPVTSLVRQILGWEKGEHFPRDWTTAYAAAFDIAEDELFPPPSRPAIGVEDDLRRRATLGAAAAAGLHRGQRVIQALHMMWGSHFDAVVDGLGELVQHYALAVCTMPADEVYDELITLRSYVDGILSNAKPARHYRDISLASGWLASLLAIAACDMGEHASARVWCVDAERHSREAGHPELAGWATLTRSMIAFYQHQPRYAADLAAHGQRLVEAGTVVCAKLAAHEMRAAAMAGDADRMVDARREAAMAIAKLPAGATDRTGAFSIAVTDDPPYTATSLMLLGRFTEAVSATSTVVRTVYQAEARHRGEHPSGYARSLLILALAHAGAGNLDEALSAGHAALAGSRPAWPTMVLAGRLDHILQRDFANARELAAYHSRYVEVANSAGRQPRPRPS